MRRATTTEVFSWTASLRRLSCAGAFLLAACHTGDGTENERVSSEQTLRSTGLKGQAELSSRADDPTRPATAVMRIAPSREYVASGGKHDSWLHGLLQSRLSGRGVSEARIAAFRTSLEGTADYGTVQRAEDTRAVARTQMATLVGSPSLHPYVYALTTGTPVETLSPTWLEGAFDPAWPSPFMPDSSASVAVWGVPINPLSATAGLRTTDVHAGDVAADSALPGGTIGISSSRTSTLAMSSDPKTSSAALDPVFGNATGGFVRRYSCCKDVAVVDTLAETSSTVTTLSPSQEVWVLDVLPFSNLDGIMQDLDEHADACKSNPSTCLDSTTRIARASNVDYYAEVYVPADGKSGYVPLPALFRRPLQYQDDSVTLEVGYKKIAEAIDQGLKPIINPPNCGDVGNMLTVNAGNEAMVFHPQSQTSTDCDRYTSCPTWKAAACPEDAEGDALELCRYESADECGGPVPDRAPSANLKYCVKNTCVHKGTCLGCEAWFESTGQDLTGWQTTTQLVEACVQDLYAEYDVDTEQCAPGDAFGCLPAVCAGNCYEYCEYQKVLMSENPYSCMRYISPYDSRSYTDAYDYECGELPVGATHQGYTQNLTTGGWTGQPDYDYKEVSRLDVLGRVGVFDMNRLDGQQPFGLTTYNLSSQSNITFGQGSQLNPRSFWFGLDSSEGFDFNDSEKDILWVKACAHLPGLHVRGPTLEYDLDDKPVGFIKKIEFGTGSFSSARICALGGFYLHQGEEPRFEWADADVSLTDIDYGGVDVDYGVAAGAAILVSNAIPVVGGILFQALLSEVLLSELAETIINETPAGGDLAQFVFEQYKAKITSNILEALNEKSKDALTSLAFDRAALLKQACDRLHPTVAPTHPYYYFYKFANEQCEIATREEYLDQAELFRKNAASEAAGCYGEDAMFNPDDRKTHPWWSEYLGQSWWGHTDAVPDQGCRLRTRVPTYMDSALWPAAKCAVANANWWFNNGVFLYHHPNQHQGYVTSPDMEPVSEAELAAQMGELNYMISKGCQSFGRQALTDLYGDGQDLAELYQSKHPAGQGFDDTLQGGG